jgi:hypothetical protein
MPATKRERWLGPLPIPLCASSSVQLQNVRNSELTSEHPCAAAQMTSRPTYSLVPEKLTVAHLVNTFTLVYGTRKFTNTFTTARHYTTSWARVTPTPYITFQSMPTSLGREGHSISKNKAICSYLQLPDHIVGGTRVSKQAG